MRPALLACVVFVFTASCFSQTTRGAVFMKSGEGDVNNGQVYWYFYLGAVDPPREGGFFGIWSLTDSDFKLKSTDKTVSYIGRLTSPLVKVPIDSHCNQISGFLTGTYKDLTIPGHWRLNAPALYTITECDIWGEFVDEHWSMGGSLVVYP